MPKLSICLLNEYNVDISFSLSCFGFFNKLKMKIEIINKFVKGYQRERV